MAVNAVAPHVAYKRFVPSGRLCVDLSNTEPGYGVAPNEGFSRELAEHTFGAYTDPDFLQAWASFVESGVAPGYHFSKTDVKKGFTNLAFAYDAARLQSFVAAGHLVVPVAAHFGGSYTPYAFIVFSRVIESTVARWAPGTCVVKTDDVITMGATAGIATETRQMAEFAVGLLFGPDRIHPDKTVNATQCMEVLGWEIDTRYEQLLIRATLHKRRKLQFLLRVLLDPGATTATREELDIMAGFVHYLALVALPARPLALYFQSLKRRPGHSRKAVVELDAVAQYALDGIRGLAVFTALLERDGRCVTDSVRFYPMKCTVCLATDASTTVGGGGLLTGCPESAVQFRWPEHWCGIRGAANALEFVASVLVLAVNRDRIGHWHRIALSTDNSANVQWFRRSAGSSHLAPLRLAVIKASMLLGILARRYSWVLSAEHVAGVDNVAPDDLSRKFTEEAGTMCPVAAWLLGTLVRGPTLEDDLRDWAWILDDGGAGPRG